MTKCLDGTCCDVSRERHLDSVTLIRTCKRLGYDVDHLYLEGVIEPAVKTEDANRSLEQNPAAIGRAQHQLTAAPGPALDRQQAPFRNWCLLYGCKEYSGYTNLRPDDARGGRA